MKDSAFQCPQPLNPKNNPDDFNKYADVDGTGTAFDLFRASFKRNIYKNNGAFYLAVGPEGCGKTSLINRCVAYFENEFNGERGEPSTTVIDISDELSPATPVAEKGKEAWETIKSLLKNEDSILTKAQVNEINDDELSLMMGVRKLSKSLEKINGAIFIILPSIELNTEFDSYMPLVKKNILAIAESTSNDLESFCKKHHGLQKKNPIQVMKLSPIAEEDGEKFVQNRLSSKSDSCPNICSQTIGKYMESRFRNGIGASIRELHLVCESVYQNAIDEGKDSIELTDFAKHYLENGVLE